MCNVVLHGNRNGKILWYYRRKTVETGIRTKPITTVTEGTVMVHAVILQDFRFFLQRNIDSND